MKKAIEELERMHIEHLKSWGAINEVTKDLKEVFSNKIIKKYTDKQITRKGILYIFKNAKTEIYYEDYKWEISSELLFISDGTNTDFERIIDRNFTESHYLTDSEKHLKESFILLGYDFTLDEFLNKEINLKFSEN